MIVFIYLFSTFLEENQNWCQTLHKKVTLPPKSKKYFSNFQVTLKLLNSSILKNLKNSIFRCWPTLYSCEPMWGLLFSKFEGSTCIWYRNWLECTIHRMLIPHSFWYNQEVMWFKDLLRWECQSIVWKFENSFKTVFHEQQKYWALE